MFYKNNYLEWHNGHPAIVDQGQGHGHGVCEEDHQEDGKGECQAYRHVKTLSSTFF